MSDQKLNDCNIDFSIQPRNIDFLFEALRGAHFRNSCFREPGTFSCAIDCFLEISYRVILKHLIGISQSLFFASMIENGTGIDLERDTQDWEIILSDIKDPVWRTVISFCRTFQARDATAEFSEIFSSQIFNSLTNDEAEIFQTIEIYEVYCPTCDSISTFTYYNTVFVCQFSKWLMYLEIYGQHV